MSKAHDRFRHANKNVNSLLFPNPALQFTLRKSNEEIETSILFYLFVCAALKFRAKRRNWDLVTRSIYSLTSLCICSQVNMTHSSNSHCTRPLNKKWTNNQKNLTFFLQLLNHRDQLLLAESILILIFQGLNYFFFKKCILHRTQMLFEC